MKALTANGRGRVHSSGAARAGSRLGLGRTINPPAPSPAELASAQGLEARELERLVDKLDLQVATARLSALEACSARNWLRDARRLIRDDELGAAQFQVAAVRRKLARRLPAEESVIAPGSPSRRPAP
jgi:hypothetical protein